MLAKLLLDDLGLPADTRIELIKHRNRRNWREHHPGPRAKIRHLGAGLAHEGPFAGRLVALSGLEPELRLMAAGLDPLDVVSVTSRLFDPAGAFLGHLAIMNLHPEGFDDLDTLLGAIAEVTSGIPGYLVASGRYYHFYGRVVLADPDWLDFLVGFLMPCVLVSPRYIGHSLFRRFCTVRLTAARPYKPTVPTLLATC